MTKGVSIPFCHLFTGLPERIESCFYDGFPSAPRQADGYLHGLCYLVNSCDDSCDNSLKVCLDWNWRESTL